MHLTRSPMKLMPRPPVLRLVWLLFESCIAFLSNVQYVQGYKGTKTETQIKLGNVVYKNPSRLNT